ncbi:hypothetical protein [Rhodopirellula sp. P2]|uniref:hypothetical protein n=1 Tax=Rhodopirellula sp. P2 TaxID=2127060 RepID=UPI002367E5CB|nr:hypothetical protein [Rhodopirellula sp. P2]WDQ19010.1 hypothetical protein PSR62_10840 [Rhodopirellula sp. P2]
MKERLRVMSLIGETLAECRGTRSADRLVSLLMRLAECPDAPLEIEFRRPTEPWEASEYYCATLCTGDTVEFPCQKHEYEDDFGQDQEGFTIGGTLPKADAGVVARVVEIWRDCLEKANAANTDMPAVNTLRNQTEQSSTSGIHNDQLRRLEYFEQEFRAIRLLPESSEIKVQICEKLELLGDELSHMQMENLLPLQISKLVEDARPRGLVFGFGFGVGVATNLFGYWIPAISPVEYDEETKTIVSPSAYFLEPGKIKVLSPGLFKSIFCEIYCEEDDERVVAERLWCEHQFSILGYYATACELLAAHLRGSSPIAPGEKTLNPPSGLTDKARPTIAEKKLERGEWMLDNCDPTKLKNRELQKMVNDEGTERGWPLFDSETGNGAFDAYKRAYLERFKVPFSRDNRGRSK